MQLLLLPLLGPLHLRYPALNAVTLRDVLSGFEPQLVATTALTADSFATSDWQDTFELPLPLSLIPWAREQGIRVTPIGEPSRDSMAEADFRRFASEMPALQEKLARHSSLEAAMKRLLGGTLTLRTLQHELLPLLRELEQELLEAAGDGPATDWRWERAGAAVARLLAAEPPGRVALLASAQDVPALERALKDRGVKPVPLPEQVAVSEAARARSLLDHALVAADDADRAALLEALEREGSAESGYARANLLLAGGRPDEALALLEQVANGDFSQPYFLPGWLLARLGQLRDLAGKRDWALQAYRGVLALSWAPAEAIEAARQGLELPFTLQPAAG